MSSLSESDTFYAVIGYGTFIIAALGEHPFKFEVLEILGEVKVQGYRRVFNHRSGWFPWVIPSPKHYFYGLLFTIQKLELKTLDRIESEGYLYDRVITQVEYQNSLYQAFIYVASKQSRATVDILKLANTIEFPDYWPAFLRKEAAKGQIPKSQMLKYPHLFEGLDFPENLS
ncbi:MAG: gamma-glutamylcyclotransferase [Candidatus Hodarchaeota archaeon]